MAASAKQNQIDVLVNEMGFARAEAAMAISDCDGNLQLAIDKLLAGEYAPPPYTDTEKDSTLVVSSRDISLDIDPGSSKQNQEKTALQNGYGLESNPPPYTKICLESELNNWEDRSTATFCKLDSTFSRTGGGSFARCSTCFDEIFENEKSGASNKAVKDGIRVCQLFHLLILLTIFLYFPIYVRYIATFSPSAVTIFGLPL